MNSGLGNEIMAKVFEVKADLQQRRPSVDGSVGNPFLEEYEEEEEEENKLAFLFLESELERRELTKLEDLPLMGIKNIIDFVSSLPANKRLFSILQAMKMTENLKFPIFDSAVAKIKVATFQPKFYCPYLTGTGYYCPNDELTYRVAALDLGYEVYPSNIGFSLPDQLICQRNGHIFNFCKIFKSSDEFLQTRHKELKLASGIIGCLVAGTSSSKFQCVPRHGYNISHKKQYADIAFTFVREYRQFSLTLQQTTSTSSSAVGANPRLSFDFLNRVKEICTYQLEDYFGEKQWQHFFTFYGTHVIVSSNGGGKLIITIPETQLKHYFKTDNLLNKVSEIEELFCNYLDMDEEDYNKKFHAINNSSTKSTNNNSKQNQALQSQLQNPFETLFINSINLIGGDPVYEGMDLIKSTKSRLELKQVVKTWVKSLQYRPIMLDSTIVLESIPDLLERYGLIGEAYLIDKAAKQLFGSSLRNGKTTLPSSAILEIDGGRRNSNLVLPTYTFS